MKIILVRHGQAEDESRPDSVRQLTDFGQQQAAQTAEYVTTHYHPDCFVVSPYDRAQQTLAALQSRAPKVPSTIQNNITPADDAREALVDLADIEAECLVVVCHMSIVAHIAGLLTGAYPESFSLAEARVFEMDFVMGGMAHEVDRFVPEQPY
ncbi:SixA phosphatase family protein [Psychrobacter immobilis]|uniref:SixA phosphatase family protein n=1 Tax=Psychrobacter immobilis TaxID=498 RepID=UPI001918D0E6|nr:histidine phosphatase family protein [Psychrobacter immobilis]